LFLSFLFSGAAIALTNGRQTAKLADFTHSATQSSIDEDDELYQIILTTLPANIIPPEVRL
jgi:hypothetical protein